MKKYRETYLKLKDGKRLSDVEIRELSAAFFGPVVPEDYHLLLSFGLLSDGDSAVLERILEISTIYFTEKNDEMLHACLIVCCIYWSKCDRVLDISLELLTNGDLGDFQDSILSAGRCVSKCARIRCSDEILSCLIDCAKRCFALEKVVLGEELIVMALEAVTGQKWVDRSKARFYFSNADAIKFDMNF